MLTIIYDTLTDTYLGSMAILGITFCWFTWQLVKSFHPREKGDTEVADDTSNPIQ